MHNVEFEYSIPETHVMQIDLDDALDYAEKEEIALEELKDEFPDAIGVEVVSITAAEKHVQAN